MKIVYHWFLFWYFYKTFFHDKELYYYLLYYLLFIPFIYYYILYIFPKIKQITLNNYLERDLKWENVLLTESMEKVSVK